jgi:hypothetical protein
MSTVLLLPVQKMNFRRLSMRRIQLKGKSGEIIVDQ